MGFMSTTVGKTGCTFRGHRWHELSWRTVWGEWAHLWRGIANAWGDHPKRQKKAG